jgi:hypothetical protein
MGKKQTQTLGQQKEGELKMARGSAKGRKKQNKNPPRWVRDCNWGSYKCMASKEENWEARWGVPGQSCPSSGFLYLLAVRSDPLFIGPCPHRDRDYHIGSSLWKLYLIKTGFTFIELVSLVKHLDCLDWNESFSCSKSVASVGRCTTSLSLDKASMFVTPHLFMGSVLHRHCGNTFWAV